MEERYEIRAKIGQGGIGSVYRAYDTKMNREVAIKRILHGNEDLDLQQEATRQISKEAGALSSLQHPHIVTVYDVGTDDDGPYVVMELINGKTLDELVERAPLTWPDFRQLALQAHEALIAAQDLNLVHSDLKPSNIMLAWLPSGKFQVKIVDFGLATLALSQTKEELEALEAVFGSIFFMPPEQFERKPLDMRSDIYSIGCVFYQALTGEYPFSGTTGEEVMNAHLNHNVIPIQELRKDLPQWAADWIMWHINRLPDDRPENAREALANFLQNERAPQPAEPQVEEPKRPRLIIPGITPPSNETPQKIIHSNTPPPPAEETPAPPAAARAEEPEPPSAPEPAEAPAPLPPIKTVHTPAELTRTAITPIPRATAADFPEDAATESPAVTPTKNSAPQPLLPPEGSKPSVHTSTHELPLPAPAPAQKSPPSKIIHSNSHGPVPPMDIPSQLPKQKLSNGAKVTIAILLTLAVLLLSWFLISKIKENKITKRYNELISLAGRFDTKEIPMSSKDLDIMLNTAASLTQNNERPAIYKALVLARPTDGKNFDETIVKFATGTDMRPDIRVSLLGDVLRMRGNPGIVPDIIAYARSAKDPEAATAALKAIRNLVSKTQFDDMLDIIQNTSSDSVRKAAEEAASEIIAANGKSSALAGKLETAYNNSTQENPRHAYIRLLGRCGGPKAIEVVKETLASDKAADKATALVALGTWGDADGYPLLIEFLQTNSDPTLRDRAFTSANRFASEKNASISEEKRELMWQDLANAASSQGEQLKIIQSLTAFDTPWAMKMLEAFTKSDDERVADRAYKAINFVKDKEKDK